MRVLQEWVAARPDVSQAREAINQNPAGALAPVPLMGLPRLLEHLGRQSSQEVGRHTSYIQPDCLLISSTQSLQVASCNILEQRSVEQEATVKLSGVVPI